jgi:hypothetical protein
MFCAVRNLLVLASLVCPTLAWAGQNPPGGRIHVHKGDSLFSGGERREARPIEPVEHTVELHKSKWRTTQDAAREDVLKEAQVWLGQWVREQVPGSNYVPDLKFLETEILVEKPRVTVGETVEVDGTKEKRYNAIAQLRLTPDLQRQILRQAERQLEKLRSEEAWSRQWLLLKGMLFLMALAGSAAGYFHFDDRTQGYYTKPLRIAAVAVLAAASYGIALLP